MAKSVSNSIPKEPAEEARTAILKAAIAEFSAHGLAGARTDAIAQAAGVNKALLYYYFKSKVGLYEAAFEEVSASVVQRSNAALDSKYTAGERLLRVALDHFDRILTQREFQALMQQEMVRLRMGESSQLSPEMQRLFGPILDRMEATVREGIRSGEICKVDWMQLLYVMFGANVFYFLSAPMMRLSLPFDPLEADAIKIRRKALVEFLGNALFIDRAAGARLARRVLKARPMPQTNEIELGRKYA
jgi:TetR/AcrR family transcriptional regulator